MAAEDRASIGASLAFEQTSQLEEAIRQAHLARLTSEFYADQDLLHIYSQLATDEDLAVADNCTSLLTQGKTAEMLDFLQEHLLSSASGKPGLEDIVLIHNRVTAFLEDWFPLAAEDGLVSFLQYEQLAGQFGNIRAYLEDLKKNADYLAAMSPVLEQNEPKSDVFTALLEYVEENYTQAISLTDLAGIFFLSPTYICDLFRRYKKTTFTNYINSLRLGRAYKLIKQTKRPLKTIAQEAGYRNYAYFNKIFKLKYSMTPSMLRKVDASEATDS